MLSDLPMFGANMFLLIGLLLVAGLLLVLILASWTTIKVWFWHIRRRTAEEGERRRRFQPDGRPYPPAGRGLCDQCGRGFGEVYHLPSGRRLCPACYQQSQGPAGRADGA